MCGIAGVAGPGAAAHAGLVEDMLGVLAHRGPDGRGVTVHDNCVLGAVRLAIVDLEGGDQPISTADGSATVAFNGEVYGHDRLRRSLDHPFRTSCDTEVLLALHQRHGASFVEHLPGMFAYALWDERRGRLECGRDAFGEKPFFWVRGPDGLVAFASEVSALLVTGWVDGRVDDGALGHLLRHGFVPPHRSIHAGVEVLPPGHRLTVDRGRVTSRRWWTMPEVDDRWGADEAAEALRARLDEAVADQLAADVPVGAFLSGGLDSSSVVASAVRDGRPLHTFSLGFGGPTDETAFARAQARRSGTSHHEVRPDVTDPVKLLRRLATVYDEPFADASAVPTFLLSEATREHVKVALTGDGADELLGGYLHWSRSFLRDAGVVLPPELGGPGPGRSRTARAAMVEAYRGFRSHLDDAQLAGLGLSRVDVPPRAWRPTGGVADLLRHDLDTYLPGDILVKTDRASMAHGLELRSPFLSRPVAELCLSLPDHLKVDGTSEKLVLRRACGDRLDPGVLRRDKLGFSGPMEDWLRREDVQGLVRDVFDDPRHPVYGLVDLEGVRPVAAGHGQAAWSLLSLALWAEEHPGVHR
jgi:asparagine synthase (glutamine-hydrolysing)